MKEILNRMLNHEELTRQETHDILVGITKSEFPMEQVTALLTALQMRGITVDELLGLRDGILETGVPAKLECDRYIDVVGTGGDQKNTFNISTTSCFVIAGAGYKVAKHGNYAATSVSGASNVIANHGVKFTDDIDKLNRCINEVGIVYLHAQLFARAMKRNLVLLNQLAGLRREGRLHAGHLEQIAVQVAIDDQQHLRTAGGERRMGALFYQHCGIANSKPKAEGHRVLCAYVANADGGLALATVSAEVYVHRLVGVPQSRIHVGIGAHVHLYQRRVGQGNPHTLAAKKNRHLQRSRAGH